MQERVVTIRNNAGIHCRPSGVILTAIKNEFPDHTFRLITADGCVTEIDSILTLISMALSKGTSLRLTVDGVDEERAIRRIGDLFVPVPVSGLPRPDRTGGVLPAPVSRSRGLTAQAASSLRP